LLVTFYIKDYIYNKKEIMKRIIRLTERDLTRIVKRVIMEQPLETPAPPTGSAPQPPMKGGTLPKMKASSISNFDKSNAFRFVNDKVITLYKDNRPVGNIEGFSYIKGDPRNLPKGLVTFASFDPTKKVLILKNGFVLNMLR